MTARPPWKGNRSLLLNDRGAIAYKTLFWLIVAFGVLYGAYKFVPPYLAYHMLKTDVENEAKVSYMYSDEKLAKRILEKAAAWNIPLVREEIEISRGMDFIAIEVRYTETIRFLGGYSKEYPVYIAVNMPIKESSRLLQ